MAQYSDALDLAFRALADPTRRSIVSSLRSGPASVGELAEPFPMALTSFLQHLRVLEDGGWIRTTKRGRVRTCTLERASFDAVEDWLDEQRADWEARTDRLESVALELSARRGLRPAASARQESAPSDERNAP